MGIIEDVMGKITCFILPVRCPKCNSWRVISGAEATKTIIQYIKKEKDLNRFEKIQTVGDYRSGKGGTAIEKYYCQKCNCCFRFVADVSHEIIK